MRQRKEGQQGMDQIKEGQQGMGQRKEGQQEKGADTATGEPLGWEASVKTLEHKLDTLLATLAAPGVGSIPHTTPEVGVGNGTRGNDHEAPNGTSTGHVGSAPALHVTDQQDGKSSPCQGNTDAKEKPPEVSSDQFRGKNHIKSPLNSTCGIRLFKIDMDNA